MSMMHLRIGSAFLLSVWTGCTNEITGPEPVLSAVEPPVVCNTQISTEVILTGGELSPLPVDTLADSPHGVLPQVALVRVLDVDGGGAAREVLAVPDDPGEPDNSHVRWHSQESLSFDVFPALALATGLHTIRVTNANGNETELSESLLALPPPTLAAIDTDLVCGDKTNTLTITGDFFLRWRGQEPEVAFVGAGVEAARIAVTTLTDCRTLPGTSGAEACRRLTVEIPAGTLDPDGVSKNFEVVVRNPALVPCATTEALTLTVVPSPTISDAEDDLICVEGSGRTLALTGTGFLRRTGGTVDLPTVYFDTIPVGATSVSGCSDLSGPAVATESCTTLSVRVPVGALVSGEYLVTVENPAPAHCVSDENVPIYVVDAPILAAVEPPTICHGNQPSEVTVTGSGFLQLDDGELVDPTVTVNGSPLAVTWGHCTSWSGTDVGGELCTRFTFPVPSGGFAEGTYSVAVVNPAPADCTTTIDFSVAAAPTVTSVEPIKVCGQSDELTVTGTGFVPGSQVELHSGSTYPAETTTFTDATTVVGEIADVPEGVYDVTVENGEGCEAPPLEDAVQVVDEPTLFFVDPPNVYNGVDMRITVWVSGIEGTEPTIWVRPTDASDLPIALSAPDFDGVNKVQATVTAGLLVAGDYDVIVHDLCEAELAGVLHVTADLTVSVTGISPGFGVSAVDPEADAEVENTGVSVFSDVDDGTLENLAKTPRVYLNPVGSEIPATEMKAVQWLNDPGQVNGIVPATLSRGSYQVVVINPDGGVGISPVDFRVLPNDDRPPVIEFLDPGQVEANPTQAVTIVGHHFPADAADIEISAVCIDAGNDTRPVVTRSMADGNVSLDTSSATVLETTWDMGSLSEYACVVRVDNLDNQTFVEYSAVSVTESSGNLPHFALTSRSLVTGRRALSGAAIRMNATSRYVFAIGGDDAGSPPQRLATVESAPVSPFGDLEDDFTVQRNRLPEGRAFLSGAAAVVGRYVYIAGGRVGSDAGSVASTVLRAYLLDPFEAPVIEQLDFVIAETGGVEAGVWYYRVAPLLDGSDANNPEGESLPSEPLVVQVPSVATGAGVNLELSWRGVTNATAYRIYRTTAPDQALGDEVLLAQVAHDGAPTAFQSFVDDGTLDNSSETTTPMPVGSLGTWHAVASLAIAREGAAIVAVPDRNDPTVSYIYVLGGRDAGGAYLDDIEWTTVAITGDNAQTLVDPVDGSTSDPFATSGATIVTPVWLLGAVFMDPFTSVATAPASYLYALPGVDDRVSGGNSEDSTTAFLIDVADGSADADGTDGDGSLSEGQAVTNPSTRYSGYGYVANHNFIHLMGGKTAGVSNTGDETYITTAPVLHAPWDAGTNLFVARHLMATAYESAFIFILGGVNGAGDTLTSVERSSF